MKKVIVWLLSLIWIAILWYLGLNQVNNSDSLEHGSNDAFSYLTDDILNDIWWDKYTCADGTDRRVLGDVCDDGDDTTTWDVVSYFGCGCQWKVQECRWWNSPRDPWSSCWDSWLVVSSNGCNCVLWVNIWWTMFATQSFDDDDRSLWLQNGELDSQENSVFLSNDTSEWVMDSMEWHDMDDMEWHDMEDMDHSQMNGSWTWSMAWCYLDVTCDKWIVNLAHDVPSNSNFDLINVTAWEIVIDTGTFVATTNQPNAIEGLRADTSPTPACGDEIRVDLNWLWQGIKPMWPLEVPCDCATPDPVCWDSDYIPAKWECNYGQDWLEQDICTVNYSKTAIANTCEYCKSDCTKVEVQGDFCGDGIKNGNESCDPLDLSELDRGTDGCSASCEKEILYCDGTQTEPQDAWTTCNDGDKNTSDDTIQDDGCTCAWIIVEEIQNKPAICWEPAYIPGEGECNYGVDAMEQNTCTPWYNESCEYCADDCQIVTIQWAYCGDGEIQADNEECDYEDANWINFWTAGCSSTCKKDEYQCGEVWFDHTLDWNASTTCSVVEEVCVPNAGSSCSYCNEFCAESIVSESCWTAPDCAYECQYWIVDQSAIWYNQDANGCDISCKPLACICENTNQAPSTPWASCDDWNPQTTNDVILDDWCTCSWVLLIAAPDPVCWEADYIPGTWECNYGQDGMDMDSCTVDYSASSIPGSCEYCTSTCNKKTIQGEYCWDAIVQSQEECDPSDTNKTNRWTDGCSNTCVIKTLYCDGTTKEPQTPWASCDDWNASTTNDMISLDGCECVWVVQQVIITPPLPVCGDGIKNGTEECDPQDINQTQRWTDGCSNTCTIKTLYCDGTRQEPQTAWASCNDWNSNTNNDVILDDGCSCEWKVEFNASPVCGEIDYIPATGECNYGQDGMPQDSCVPWYDSSSAQSCDYCKSDCTIVTETGGYCWDGIKNGTEECDANDVNQVNRWTAWCSVSCLSVATPITYCPGTTEEPKSPWVACDDGDMSTYDDTIQINGCDCEGTPKTYSWSIAEYGACSVACGGWDEIRNVTCIQNDSQEEVDDSLCTQTKPIDARICNTQACETYDRFVDEWNSCSDTCGGWTQSRTVQCRRFSDNTIVEDEMCGSEKPAIEQTCNTQMCDIFEWHTEEWSLCDATCEGWTRNRVVTCVNTVTKQRVGTRFCLEEKPLSVEECNTQVCETYNRRETSRGACTKACGDGEQSRTIECIDVGWFKVEDELCSWVKPSTYRSCNLQECESYNRVGGEWSLCSHECDWGTQTRDVECQTRTGALTQNDNCEAIKPSNQRNCNVSVCEQVHNTASFWWWGSGTRDIAYCGDGIVNGDETCDDGNYQENDGCNRRCGLEQSPIIQLCGDGIVDSATESCDDGNYINGDGCSRTCDIEQELLFVISCGDGELHEPTEECDDGNKNNSDGCTNNCTVQEIILCGDGEVDRLTEECDDGNSKNGDGCSTTCEVEIEEDIITQILNTQSLISEPEPFDYTASFIDLPTVLPKTWSIIIMPVFGLSALVFDLGHWVYEFISTVQK